MRRKSIIYTALLTILSFLFINNSHCQVSIIRQCINSYGASVVTNSSLRVSQTAGQPYHTATNFDKQSQTRYNPGFQQNHLLFGYPGEKDDDDKKADTTLSGLTIYPNPANNNIYIGPGNKAKGLHFRVMNSNGNIVYEDKNEHAGKYVINCADWPAGIYFITAYNKHNYHSYKVLIIK